MSTTSAKPRGVHDAPRYGDRIFAGAATGAGVIILLVLAGVAGFLLWQALPALTASPEDVRGGKGLFEYIYPLAFGTILTSVIALVIATPLSVGIALFITHYAPRRIALALGYVVDLLAAVPSIIYGLWGVYVVAPASVPVATWLSNWLGFLPFFGPSPSASGRTTLVVGVVLAIMILPVMTAVNREVFLQTPRLHEEASLALGATRWEMIRQAVLPFGRSAVISGAMLGLGRALGETMAVAIILSTAVGVHWDIIGTANSSTIAADIALQFPESSGLDVNTLIAAGLVLFFITLLVNMAARWVVSRRSEFSGAN
ncbi:phosphate ABC transporter permease subunit PstC [Nostocoides sp. Soil756]|uniref:phosphate ABC transporter permease subunit PstC n=1 Tax=Nostocoides sp. Soil756 TaxID=1736399 RepID=UPI0006F2A261|nr:phosphate ABC transporter permease subunit PstC [Tetrasphaera sp. Soil756]KRE60081.1 phosphate ABC transporter permease [Tetrasphaera sp. Soil756]